MSFKQFHLIPYFLSHSLRVAKTHGASHLFKILLYLPAWLRSRENGHTSLDDREPWITLPAFDFLRRNLDAHFSIFEWGCGGSTAYFSRSCQSIISIEHDPDWAGIVLETLSRLGSTNASVNLILPAPVRDNLPPDPSDPLRYSSSCATYTEYSFREYATAIEQYTGKTFDLIFVDGRARPSCILHALPYVASGGFLLLDNSDRSYYHEQLPTVLHNWRKYEFPGPFKHSQEFGMTTIWKKPALENGKQ